MAARPYPLSALKLCIRLAKNSRRRLEASIETTENVLETNIRLTPAERAHYREAINAAKAMIAGFKDIAATPVPRAAPSTPRKIGRPSQKEIAKAEASRRG